ncbi:hypothetical protein HDV01_003199, partial [Terramyces sp. JEL0728]
MDLEKFPLEIHHAIINHITGNDILNLALVNKFYFELLSPFRAIARVFHFTTKSKFWPDLHVTETTKFRAENLQKFYLELQEMQRCGFRFRIVSIYASIYHKLAQFLPSTEKRKLWIDQKSSVDDLANLQGIDEITVLYDMDQVMINRLAEIVRDTKLNSLVMCFCHLTDQDVLNFARVLPGSSLTTLDLSKGDFSGAAIQALTKTLPQTNIADFRFPFHRLSPRDLQDFFLAMKGSNIRYYNIQFNFQVFDQHLQVLYRYLPIATLETRKLVIPRPELLQIVLDRLADSNFKRLEVECTSNILEQLLKGVKDNPLELFKLHGSPFGTNRDDLICKYINVLSTKAFSLGGCFDVVRIISSIKNTKIKHVCFVAGMVGQVDNITPFLKTTSIKSLSIMGSNLKDDTLHAFIPAMKSTKIRKLVLNNNKFTAEGILEFVEAVKESNLQFLGFENTIESKVLCEQTRKEIRLLLEGNIKLAVAL